MIREIDWEALRRSGWRIWDYEPGACDLPTDELEEFDKQNVEPSELVELSILDEPEGTA